MLKTLRNLLILVGIIVLLCMVYNQVQQSTNQPIYASFSVQSASSPPALHAPTVVRISQLDPGQYASGQEFDTWAYSACSSAAMTEVVNAYGGHYRIHDILVVEERVQEITPELGVLEDSGIQHTMAQPPFRMQTTWGYNLSYSQIIAKANAGIPVIVSWPPSRYTGGHLVVVTGGNASEVYLADSSIWDRHVLSRAQFLHWWAGFYAIVRPLGQQALAPVVPSGGASA